MTVGLRQNPRRRESVEIEVHVNAFLWMERMVLKQQFFPITSRLQHRIEPENE